MESPEPIEGLVHSPCIELEGTGGEKLQLTWFNTTIRCFEDPQFNHIEMTTESGEVIGLRVGQELMDLLFEHTYPYYSMPYVDEATREWFVHSLTKNLEQEIAEL